MIGAMWRSKTGRASALVTLVVAGLPVVLAQQSPPQRGGDGIRLVLQVTVDGLRADLLARYRANFGEGGFRYLLDRGVVYTDAQYLHANTETIVGHATLATLATGAHPARHGMIGNVWYDREAGELAYNIEDPDYPLLPTRDEAVEGAQVDPAQKRARTKGRSPVSLLVPTLADTLAAHTAGASKIYGVSGKDRSAVAMAGQVGKAFWISTDTGDFVTSSYYYDAYPDWAARWNAARKGARHAGKSWELSRERSAYRLAEQDDRPYEVDLENPLFPTLLLVSPVGDELAADFVKTLIDAENVGQDAVVDYVSVSFSGVDAVNHFFGPSSLENEEVVLRLDRTLADLLAFVDAKVGLSRTLVVLSADHGMAEMPEYMTELGYEVGRLDPQDVHALANEAGKRLFGVDGLVRFTFRPYLYLDPGVLEQAGLDRDDVADAIADALTHVAGLAVAASRRQIAEAREDPVMMRVRRNHHPSRSGEIYLAQEPYWFFFEKGPVGVMHGSPWRYDTHVPIVFAGAGLSPARVNRRVHPIDVAPTIAAVLGLSGPAAAAGAPLAEVVRQP